MGEPAGVGAATVAPRSPDDVLVVLAAALRTDATATTLSLLRWCRGSLGATPRTVVLGTGPLQAELRRAGARVVGEPPSLLAVAERTLRWMGARHGAQAVRLIQYGGALWRPTRPRVVYCTSVQAAWLTWRFLARRSDLVVHAFEAPDELERLLEPPWGDRLVRRTGRWLAGSEHTGQALVEAGVAPERIMVRPAFVDRPVLDAAVVQRVRAAVGLRAGETLVGGIGAGGWRDGADVFIRVASVLRRRWPRHPFRFVWVGAPAEGPGRWVLEHDIERAGLADRFVLCGDQRDAAAWMSLFTVLCLPGRVAPPATLGLEAAMLDVPVVAFDRTVGGSPNPGGALAGAVVVPYLDVEAMARQVAARAGAVEDVVTPDTAAPPAESGDRCAPQVWSVLDGTRSPVVLP